MTPTRARAAETDLPACPPHVDVDVGRGAGVGLVDPFRAPAAGATVLNSDAKALYRLGKWDDARAKYHAAVLADPDFLAPVLNIACSFVRQERFDEATREVIQLLDRAFVPWAAEISSAADLGALKAQPQMARVRQALADAARRWGAGLDQDLLFVARQREPLKLPAPTDVAAPVVLVLGLHQEVFAWSPLTARYRQLTSEEGRVLAMTPSLDRRSLLYVTAEKLVRNPRAATTLRGVGLHTLTLATMVSDAPIPLDGDITRLSIAPQPGGFALDVDGDKLQGPFSLIGDRTQLTATRPPSGRRADHAHAPSLVSPVVLTGAGVTSAAERTLPEAGACHLIARQARDHEGRAIIQVQAAPGDRRGGRTGDRPGHGGPPPTVLLTRFGAGFSGLSIP